LSISVTNTKSPITVVDDKVTIKVTGGFGPQGPAGSSESGGGAIASINGQTGTITIAYAGGVTAAGGTITLGYVSPPVTSVAGRTGAVTLSTGDVSGLGSLATKSSLGNITIAGAVGTVAGRVLTTDADGLVVTSAVGVGLVYEDDSIRPDIPYIKSQLADVASSGSYLDLTNKPTIPVTSVAGRTGAVTLTTSDVSGYAAPPVTSVAGRTGAVTIAAADVSGLSAAAPVQSVAGRTGAVTLTTSDVSGYTAPPVTSVAGRTGAVTIAAADVSGLSAAAPVQSVAGRTGAVTLTTSDVSGYTSPPVTSVAGRTGAVTLTGSDINVATTTALGVVQVGVGLTVTAGVLSGPNITSGTAAPSGGSSGDIYLRYSA
jgi:hypothetical protein